ncbi:hypothetical protein LINGRAHAP2_LOCUS2670, partial [Linum grandiflorum]
MWSSILKGRVALLQGIRRNIGNGESTWLDEMWVPGLAGFKCHPLFALNCRISDCVLQPSHHWNVVKLQSIFPPHMVKEIVQIPIGPPNFPDSWVWHWDSKGRFSVRSCYMKLNDDGRDLSIASSTTFVKTWKWLWALAIPPKIKFFLWRLCHNAIATK